MAIADGEIFRAVWRFDQAGNKAVMVAFFELLSLTAGNDETDMADAFYNEIWEATFRDVVHESAQLVSVEITPAFGGDAVGLYEGNKFGQAGGEKLAPFIAMNVKQSLSVRSVRSGQKRIPFIAEGFANGNLPVLDPVLRAQIESFFGDSTTIDWTNEDDALSTMVIFPVVVGRTNVGTELEPEYILDPTKVHRVRKAEVNRITSQNSRKT